MLAASMAAFSCPANADDVPVSIIMLGDSYFISQGVAPTEGFEAKLQAALDAAGLLTKVVDTGYLNGTENGVGWIKSLRAKKVFAAPANYAAMIELGSNDCGDPELDQTRANLDQILARFAESHIPVMVVGTTAYTICEHFSRPTYPTEYFQMFGELAAKYGDLYYPDFKQGISDHPDLMQPDQDHPNAKGDAAIVAYMLPMVKALVARAIQP